MKCCHILKALLWWTRQREGGWTLATCWWGVVVQFCGEVHIETSGRERGPLAGLPGSGSSGRPKNNSSFCRTKSIWTKWWRTLKTPVHSKMHDMILFSWYAGQWQVCGASVLRWWGDMVSSSTSCDTGEAQMVATYGQYEGSVSASYILRHLALLFQLPLAQLPSHLKRELIAM